jgi:hypothetical protein
VKHTCSPATSQPHEMGNVLPDAMAALTLIGGGRSWNLRLSSIVWKRAGNAAGSGGYGPGLAVFGFANTRFGIFVSPFER